MKGKRKTKKIFAAAGIICFALLCWISAPALVQAASPAIHSVDITVDLNEDGSAQVTEVWNVTITDGTEYYLTKYGLLEGQDITNLLVTDENGREYTNIGQWDSGRSGAEKYGECGLIAMKGGYEICWGVYRDYGDHVYTVRYTMPGLLQAYEGADAINQTFIPENLLSSPQKVNLTIRRAGVEFTQDNTKVWAFGATGEIYVENGQVEFGLTSQLKSSQYVAVLVRFDPGMFSPAVNRGQTFEEAKSRAMEGSDYNDSGTSGGTLSGLKLISEGLGVFNTVFLILLIFVISPLMLLAPFFVMLAPLFAGRKTKGKHRMKKEYKQPQYSRELPWNNNLQATYTRLNELGQLNNEGAIIGTYILRWILNRQVDLVYLQSGLAQPETLKLYQPRDTMPPLERELYNMMIEASGLDWILQSKEFEKWSRRNHRRVRSWMLQCQYQGETEMRLIGAFSPLEKKSFGGRRRVEVALNTVGEQYTIKMFGFKKYLEEFTIINEREAREVELWREYLIYAQLFGIADRVAEQFRFLYPDYFVQMGAYGGRGMGIQDIYWASRMTRSFGDAVYRGATAGYNASRGGGGGGRSSSGGGGGGGGSSGGGGGGGTR